MTALNYNKKTGDQ